MAIASMPSVVIDCPDPAVLAEFYGTMLDWKVELDDGWADIRAPYGQCISFQRVEDYAPPVWPEQDVPQQMHLDVMVEDLDEAETEVVRLGATKAEHQPGETFRSGCSWTRPGTRSASASSSCRHTLGARGGRDRADSVPTHRRAERR